MIKDGNYLYFTDESGNMMCLCENFEVEEVMIDLLSGEQFVKIRIWSHGDTTIIELPRSDLNRSIIPKLMKRGLAVVDEIILKLQKQVKWFQGVMSMAKSDAELLNAVYKEIGEKMGLDAAMEIYQMFKGQQISFPVRFFNPKIIRQSIIQEYDGSNVRMLAIKYGYSEKTIRRIIKESVAEK